MTIEDVLKVALPFALGGMTAAFITHLFAKERAYREYRLKKIEELHLLTAEFVLRVQDPTKGIEEVSSKMFIIVDLYFPKLKEALQRVTIHGTHREHTNTNNEVSALREALKAEQRRLI